VLLLAAVEVIDEDHEVDEGEEQQNDPVPESVGRLEPVYGFPFRLSVSGKQEIADPIVRFLATPAF
jgi:hypothetical protein